MEDVPFLDGGGAGEVAVHNDIDFRSREGADTFFRALIPDQFEDSG